nr:hypothetical protein Iba_scaffold156.2CG0860 [Ipomoea batatas]
MVLKLIMSLMMLIKMVQSGSENPLLAENLSLHIEGDLQLDEEDLLDEIPTLLPVGLLFVVEILLIDVLTLHLQDGGLHLHQEEGVHPLHQGVSDHHLGGLLEESVEVLFEGVLPLHPQEDVHPGEHVVLPEGLPLVADVAALL